MMYVKAQSLDTKTLLMEKQCQLNASTSTDDTSSNLIPQMTWRQKKISERYGKILSNLRYDFITRSLERLVDFLSDDAQESLHRGHTNGFEKIFLKDITTACRSKNVQAVFDQKHRKLIRELCKLLDGTNFKMRTTVNNTKGLGKEIVYIKEPRLENAKQQKDISWSKASNINFQAGGLMTEMTFEGGPLLIEVTQKHDMPKNILESLKPKEPKPNQTQPKRGRNFKGEVSNVKPYNKDQQLIDALSVPVKSDKALKMMMGMGWTGGALGPRGNGITEPIMPHLRNDTAAGLGHTKAVQVIAKQIQRETCVESVLQIEKRVRQPEPPRRQPDPPRRQPDPPRQQPEPPRRQPDPPRQQPDPPRRQPDPPRRQPAEFRKILLRSMLDLLNSSDLTMTLDINPCLTRKERRFISFAECNFAARTKFPLEDDEQTIADEVAKHYANDLELLVTVCFSDDSRQIFLNKEHSVVLTQKVKINNIDVTIDKDPKRAMYQLLDKFQPLFQSQSLFDLVQFRVRALLQLLNFVKDENEKQINILRSRKLSTRGKDCLELCIDGINKRARFGSTKGEIELSREIKRHLKVGVYALSIRFSGNLKSYTVTKDYEATFPQTADLGSSGDDIDYSSSDNDDDMTDKNEDKIMKQLSNINDATEKNNHKNEGKIENGSELNINDNLEPQVVNESDLNVSELAKAIEEHIDEIKTGGNIPESDI